MKNFKFENILPLKKGNATIIKENNNHNLYLDDILLMSYNEKTKLQAKQLYSHYQLAKGDVLCSGLGLGIRENWLIKKEEVESVTVVEKSKDVIDIFSNKNQISIINEDIYNYKGKCDVLLLDHYIHPPNDLNNIKKILKNIECKIVWWWGIEELLKNGDIMQNYLKLKMEIPQLPNLDKDTVVTFVRNYFNLK